MAKYQVTHSCGCTETHQLYGKQKDRDSKIEWLEGTLCRKCYRAEKAKEREQANERAGNLAESLGFVALTGSEKQVAWAQTIRQGIYEDIIKHNTIVDADVAVKILNLETTAKWWIDNRDDHRSAVVRTICGNYKDQARQIEADFLAAKKAS